MEVAATNRSNASFRLRPGNRGELRVGCAVVRIRKRDRVEVSIDPGSTQWRFETGYSVLGKRLKVEPR